jgi:UDP-N-acetylglucosamine:LPS N-acetylglucosamine transferase
MERQYARATAAVTRAGAVTVAELAVVGLPAVLVPLPGAPGDHQTRNAETVAAAGGAVLVPDGDATAERLTSELDALLTDPARLEAMGRAARTLGRPDAAARVAALVEEAARA